MNQEIGQSGPESAPRREFSNSAEDILRRLSRDPSGIYDREFYDYELVTIVKAWETLDPEIKNLALVAYPRIAIALLNRKLNPERQE